MDVPGVRLGRISLSGGASSTGNVGVSDPYSGPAVYAVLAARARDRGLSMSALADQMGISRSVFSRWKTGTGPLYAGVMQAHAFLDTLPLHAAAQQKADLLG